MKDLGELLLTVMCEVSSLNEWLADARRTLEPALPEIRGWGPALASPAVDAWRCAAEPNHLMRPERHTLVELMAQWYEQLVDSDRTGPWMDTCALGLFLTAAGVTASEMVTLATRMEEQFVERCRVSVDREGAMQVALAFSQLLHRACAMMVACHDVLMMVALSDVGVPEALARRLPYVSARRLVREGTRHPQRERSTTALARVRTWLSQQLAALQDPRARQRPDEEVDVRKALQEALEQLVGGGAADGPAGTADPAATVRRVLRRFSLEGNGAAALWRLTPSRNDRPN